MDPNIRILFWIARDINGSWIGADRFEIFRERERGVVNEMHDFHNEIGRKGSASARASKYRNVESNGSVNSRQLDGLRSARPSSGLSMNNFRRSSKVRMNRTRPDAGRRAPSYLNVKWNRAEQR